jgi:hypothetical protein
LVEGDTRSGPFGTICRRGWSLVAPFSTRFIVAGLSGGRRCPRRIAASGDLSRANYGRLLRRRWDTRRNGLRHRHGLHGRGHGLRQRRGRGDQSRCRRRLRQGWRRGRGDRCRLRNSGRGRNGGILLRLAYRRAGLSFGACTLFPLGGHTLLLLPGQLDGTLASPAFILREPMGRVRVTGARGCARRCWLRGAANLKPGKWPLFGRMRRRCDRGRIDPASLGLHHHGLGTPMAEALLHHAGTHRTAGARFQRQRCATAWRRGSRGLFIVVRHAIV